MATASSANSSSPASPADSPSKPSISLSQMAETLPGFKAVEALVRSKFTSDAPLLSEISSYLFTLGGKRIRPVMTLLTGALFGMKEPSQPLIDVAAGIELIHMATLLHDDIIDKSPLRRHKRSPFAEYGTENTLLAGDFLLTRAFSLCAHLDRYVIDRTEAACVALTEGEILEVPLWKQQHSIESSITIARKKTAALFRLGGECGAHLAGAGTRATEAMGEFGEAIGTAFQILDDILDVTSDETLLGKKSGLDLIERKPSLVNVLWLSSGTPLSRRLLEAPGEHEDDFARDALAELRGSAVVAEARRMADEFASQAKRSLDLAVQSAPSADRGAYASYLGLIDFTIQRLS